MMLHYKFPRYLEDGTFALLNALPTIYSSIESPLGVVQHLCRQLGLPLSCVRPVPVNTHFGKSVLNQNSQFLFIVYITRSCYVFHSFFLYLWLMINDEIEAKISWFLPYSTFYISYYHLRDPHRENQNKAPCIINVFYCCCKLFHIIYKFVWIGECITFFNCSTKAFKSLCHIFTYKSTCALPYDNVIWRCL